MGIYLRAAVLIILLAGSEWSVQNAHAGTPDRAGNNAEVYSITVTPEVVSPGARPVIKGYVRNVSREANGNSGKAVFDIVAVVAGPDGTKKALVWNDVNFQRDQKKFYVFEAAIDTAATGTYKITYSVYNSGRTFLYNSASRFFAVSASPRPAEGQKKAEEKPAEKQQKKQVQPAAEQPQSKPAVKKPEEERLVAGLGAYVNAINPSCGGTIIIWPFKDLAVQATYGVGTFTSYEARIFYRMSFPESLRPYIGAGYIHSERQAAVLGVDTTFKASSFTGFVGVEVPLYKNLYAYADVSGTPLKMSQTVQSGTTTATATVDYSPVTVNVALVLYLF